MSVITEACYHIAKTRDRYRAAGDIESAERAQDRLMVQVQRTEDPSKTLADLVERLERAHAFRS